MRAHFGASTIKDLKSVNGKGRKYQMTRYNPLLSATNIVREQREGHHGQGLLGTAATAHAW